MPISDADVQTVHRFYAARDLASMGSCFAPEAVWHFPGKGAIAGDHTGWPAIRDAIGDFQAKIGPLSGGTFRGELLDVAVGEHYVVAVQHGSAQREGRKFDVTACQLMRVEAGHIVEVWGHYSDQYALDSFWPGHLEIFASPNDLVVHHRDRPQWRRNEKARWWVSNALDATVGRCNDVVEGVVGQVGQLHALEAGPQALHRVQLRA